MLPRPWDSPGKNTGVGCHCLLRDGTSLSHKKEGNNDSSSRDGLETATLSDRTKGGSVSLTRGLNGADQPLTNQGEARRRRDQTHSDHRGQRWQR